jgi:putative hydrolase of the HAD superfamily
VSDGDVRLVVFDLGRVLVRICDGWQHACQVAGVKHAPVGRLGDEAYAAIHAAMCAHEVGELDVDGFARVASPHLGVSTGDFIRMHGVYTIGPYEGTASLLDDLRTAGVTTACLSNTNENHWRRMSEPGPARVPFDKFAHCFASHLLRLRKPDDAIYAHVERATETPPEKIVFFDDVEENITAAARRGWHAHRIATDSDSIAQVRDCLRTDGILA